MSQTPSARTLLQLLAALALLTAPLALTACSDDDDSNVDETDTDVPDDDCEPGFRLCGEECVDTTSSALHCGACDNACPRNANERAPTCEDSQCVSRCQPGFEDCNEDPSDGCEINIESDDDNCGVCGRSCNGRPNSSGGFCDVGICALTCTGSFRNCNSNVSDGCEINTATDTRNCGTCNNNCELVSAIDEVLCETSQCAILTCAPGFEDCNASHGDGCEQDITTSPSACGSCETTGLFRCLPTSGPCSGNQCLVALGLTAGTFTGRTRFGSTDPTFNPEFTCGNGRALRGIRGTFQTSGAGTTNSTATLGGICSLPEPTLQSGTPITWRLRHTDRTETSLVGDPGASGASFTLECPADTWLVGYFADTATADVGGTMLSNHRIVCATQSVTVSSGTLTFTRGTNQVFQASRTGSSAVSYTQPVAGSADVVPNGRLVLSVRTVLGGSQAQNLLFIAGAGIDSAELRLP